MIEVPDNWEHITLGELGKFSTSSVDKKISNEEIQVRLINYMDVYNNDFINESIEFMEVTATPYEVEMSQVKIGDILFVPSSETPDDISHSAVVTETLPKTLHSYHTMILRVSNKFKLHIGFSGRLGEVPSVKNHLQKRATGSTRYTLSIEDFSSAPLSLPPYWEQVEISEIIQSFDDSINQATQLLNKLRMIKTGLVNDLMLKNLSEEDAVRKKIADVCDLIRDGTHGTHTRITEGIPFLSAKNITAEGIVKIDENESKISIQDYLQISRNFPIKENDVLLTIVGSIGRRAIHDGSKITFQRSVAMLRTNLQLLHPRYLYHFISHEIFQGQLKQRSNATAQSGVYLGEIAKIEILLPSMKYQLDAIIILDDIDERVGDSLNNIRKLTSLKQGVINDLLTGKVRIPSN